MELVEKNICSPVVYGQRALLSIWHLHSPTAVMEAHMTDRSSCLLRPISVFNHLLCSSVFIGMIFDSNH